MTIVPFPLGAQQADFTLRNLIFIALRVRHPYALLRLLRQILTGPLSESATRVFGSLSVQHALEGLSLSLHALELLYILIQFLYTLLKHCWFCRLLVLVFWITCSKTLLASLYLTVCDIQVRVLPFVLWHSTRLTWSRQAWHKDVLAPLAQDQLLGKPTATILTLSTYAASLPFASRISLPDSIPILFGIRKDQAVVFHFLHLLKMMFINDIFIIAALELDLAIFFFPLLRLIFLIFSIFLLLRFLVLLILWLIVSSWTFIAFAVFGWSGDVLWFSSLVLAALDEFILLTYVLRATSWWTLYICVPLRLLNKTVAHHYRFGIELFNLVGKWWIRAWLPFVDHARIVVEPHWRISEGSGALLQHRVFQAGCFSLFFVAEGAGCALRRSTGWEMVALQRIWSAVARGIVKLALMMILFRLHEPHIGQILCLGLPLLLVWVLAGAELQMNSWHLALLQPSISRPLVLATWIPNWWAGMCHILVVYFRQVSLARPDRSLLRRLPKRMLRHSQNPLASKTCRVCAAYAAMYFNILLNWLQIKLIRLVASPVLGALVRTLGETIVR